MNRRWLLNKTNSEFIQHIARTASVSPVFARVLVNRGLKSADRITEFLNPDITRLSDPFGIDGVSGAVKRIKAALKANERILVHGDYDADGISATAIVYQSLKRLGSDCLYFIPERFSHGYGFHPHGVLKARDSGASLIITVDCGITSFDAVAAAKKEGIDVIITDHHEPAKVVSHNGTGEVQLPDAYAVINPKISNLGTALENLSGAGVALKLMQALCGSDDPDMQPLFDLATLGTIADVVPLTEENRMIVRNGLSLINKGNRPWMKALMKVAGVEGRDIKAQRLAYSVIPRINAAGRLASSSEVVKLLTTDSEDEAWELAVWLDRLNAERQRIEEGILQEAIKKLDGKGVPSAIVLSGRGWHEGVIGIVASRIAEKFSRPTVIFSLEGGIAKGSARSVPAFDICKALSSCDDLLISYGGHKQAAGVKLNEPNLLEFAHRLRCLCDSVETGKPADITIDADVSLTEVNFGLIRELNMLEPIGLGNPEPLFGGRMLDVLSPRIVGSRHVKMKLCQRSHCVDTIGFDMGGFIDKLDLYETVDAVFTPTVNEWNGGKNIQLVLKAFRPSSSASSSES